MNKLNEIDWDDYSKKVNSVYPSEMLIRFYNKFLNSIDNPRILEIGCGVGRNTLYLSKMSNNVTSIDISPLAISKTNSLLKNNKTIAKTLCVKIQDFEFKKYDAVIDISSLQHISHSSLCKIIPKIYEALNQGGAFLSITKHPKDYIQAFGNALSFREKMYDEHFDKLTNPCMINFLSKEDILQTYKSFSNLEINTEKWTYDNGKKINSHWIIWAQKK